MQTDRHHTIFSLLIILSFLFFLLSSTPFLLPRPRYWSAPLLQHCSGSLQLPLDRLLDGFFYCRRRHCSSEPPSPITATTTIPLRLLRPAWPIFPHTCLAMTKMDHISSRFRRSKKAAQAATSPSSPDQPSPDGSNGTSPISVTSVTAPTTMPATMPTTATTTAPVSSATSATSVPPGTQQPRHESPPALSISTTTPPGSGHSIPNNICDRSPNGNQGLRSTLHPPKSPFRNFHFRSSNKRARSPAPPTLAIPTPPAIVNHDGTIGHEMTSPLRYQQQQPPTNGGEMVVDKPKIPAFLTLSETGMSLSSYWLFVAILC